MQVENTGPLKPTRSSFIRSLPESMPIDEVIERGREIGLVIQPTDVHSVRYYMRQTANPAKKDPPSGARGWLRIDGENGLAKATPSPASPPPPKAVAKQEPPRQAAAQRRERKMLSAAEKLPKENEALRAQLRILLLRLGSERTRAIIDELEGMAGTLSARKKKR